MSKDSSGRGVGICCVITIVLAILRFVNVIQISWLWVFCPLWIPTALYLLVSLVILITASSWWGSDDYDF